MDPYSLIALIMVVVTTAMRIALQPKPIPPVAASLSDFQVPTAEAGRPVPVVFGTVLIAGPNVIWYGDKRTEPIPAPSGGSGGGS